MPVLMWERPARAEPVEEWKARSADSAPPGVYSPNMSEADMHRWKARLVGQRKGDPRVEIRKTVSYRPEDRSERGYHAQMLIIVWPASKTGAAHVRMSLNGTADMRDQEWIELTLAIAEAHRRLASL